MKKIFRIIEHELLAAMSGIWLWVFLLSVEGSTVKIWEPSTPMAVAELVICVGVLGFAVYAFTEEIA